MGTDALCLMGFRAYQSHRAAPKFLRHEEESLRELTEQRKDRTRYLKATRQRIEDLERLLQADLNDQGLERDLGWDAESLRAEFADRSPGSAPPAPEARN